MSRNILVTGSAGFIGFHLTKKLLENDYKVIGIDNINDYYDTKLKQSRLDILNDSSLNNKNWNFFKTDLRNKEKMSEIFKKYKPSTVVNLAAQAGVRYSLKNPESYINSNIVGFSNILECCRQSQVNNFIYASSSSVYGGNTNIPFSENDSVDHPVSLYAATKRSNELMAHTYSHLYGIPTTGLRFFTVYGPWGRPDMAPMIFTDSIINRKPIKVFNYGEMSRSFTYIDDVIEVMLRLINKRAKLDNSFNANKPNCSTSWCPYMILNLGNNSSVKLLDFIQNLEKELCTNAIKKFLPMQEGDVKNTLCDSTLIKNWIGDIPKTSLAEGIKKFIDWYKDYYS